MIKKQYVRKIACNNPSPSHTISLTGHPLNHAEPFIQTTTKPNKRNIKKRGDQRQKKKDNENKKMATTYSPSILLKYHRRYWA